MAIFIDFFQKADPYNLKFKIGNVSNAFVNAIRRTVISEIPTIGFDTAEYTDSSLTIIDNSSSLHNEYILHRLGLIPIFFKNVNDFDTSNYTFSINVENKTEHTIDVTSKDFKVFNKTTGLFEDTLDFFKPDPITGDHILITRLKPNFGSDGEKLNITGSCIMGVGSYNASFSPVSVSIFTNSIDNAKVETELKEYISDLEIKKGSKLTLEEFEDSKNKFIIDESERHYFIDSNGEPYVFDFNIESIGIMKSSTILFDACTILEDKIKYFITLLNNDNNDDVEIVSSDAIMDAMDVIIKDETHTLGNLLQNYIYKYSSKDELLFVGYKNPHPLIKTIVLRLSLKNNNVENVKKIITDACNKALDDFNTVKTLVSREFPNISKPIKVVKKIIKKNK
jgi:DNA-directed RNA polymerase subunit L